MCNFAIAALAYDRSMAADDNFTTPQSRTRAAGARSDTRGSVRLGVNMGLGGFDFGAEHSAQWLYGLQKTMPFWAALLKTFDVAATTE